MKRTLFLIACVAICFVMMVSCRNTRNSESTPEEIQQQKQALADSVLAQVDAIADQLLVASSKAFSVRDLVLTNQELRVKPDYLLDPSYANTLLTRKQKINALAVYATELPIRRKYGMPEEEAIKAITKLASEVNHPTDLDLVVSDAPASARIEFAYKTCRERGDLSYFWQFEEAVGIELTYILTQNSDMFFSKISKEQWQAYCNRRFSCMKAIQTLAKYDEEMADLAEFIDQYWSISEVEKATAEGATLDEARQYLVSNKDKFVAKRYALIQ